MQKSISLLLAWALGLGATGAGAETAAGEVLLITGRGTATNPADGAIRDLSKGASVYSGEVINSSANSYINLKFADGGYILLRPNTRFAVEDFAQGGAAAPAAVAPAPAARPPAQPATPPAPVAAAPATPGDWSVVVETYATAAEAQRAVRGMQGRGLEAEAVAVQIRPGTTWHRVFVRRLADRAAAEQVLVDLKRVGFRNPTIVPGTRSAAPAIAAPPPEAAPAAPGEPEPASPAAVAAAPAAAQQTTSRAYFRLLKGGFRAVSGLIGKSDPAEYRVSTPVATIGIRGTDYLVILCDAACANDPVIVDALPEGSSAQGGLIVGVIQGGVFVVNEDGKVAEVAAGQYLVTLPDGTQIYLPFEPRFLRIDPIPNPLTICEQE